MNLLFSLLAQSPYFPSLRNLDAERPSSSLDAVLQEIEGHYPTESTADSIIGFTQRPSLSSDISPERLAADLLKAWSQANFYKAFEALQPLFHWANTCKDENALFMIHLVGGSLNCGIGRYSDAHQDFRAASQLIQLKDAQFKDAQFKDAQFKDAQYKAILSSKIAWLHILENQLDEAKTILADQTQTSRPDLNAHNCVLMAIIKYLEADEVDAEEKLQVAAEYYSKHDHRSELSVIQLYQSALYLHSDTSGMCQFHLKQSLEWMEKNKRTYLPYWWHPEIMDIILTKAIETKCYPEQAHRLIERRQYVYETTATQHRQIGHRVSSNAREARASLYPNGKGRSRKPQRELNTLLNSRVLDEKRLLGLAQKIPHGLNRDRINPTIIALFGLHIQGISQSKIVARLAVTNNTVKSYTTKIYNAFELNIKDFPNATARRQALIEKAKEEGYVLSLPPKVVLLDSE